MTHRAQHVVSIAAAAALVPAAAFAHHSRAAYDMTQEIVLEGTVADLQWKNPHIFMTIENERSDGAPSSVEVEVTSISEAHALGLPREALAPGSRVVVRAHPGRRTPVTTAVGLEVKTGDGAVYPLNVDAKLAIRARAVEAGSIAGNWAPTLESFNAIRARMGSWPLTDAGRAASAAAQRRAASSGSTTLGICAPFPPPILSVFPDLRTIEVNGGTVTLRFEGAVGVPMERVVHLDERIHPANVAPSLMGHSIGRWEGDTLVIDTVGFSPHDVGGFFFPSGPNKHLVERLTLTAERTQLMYVLTLEDPDMLIGPASYAATWDHRPDLTFSGEACDPDVARRALQQ
jgi:hypothetical protein